MVQAPDGPRPPFQARGLPHPAVCPTPPGPGSAWNDSDTSEARGRHSVRSCSHLVSKAQGPEGYSRAPPCTGLSPQSRWAYVCVQGPATQPQPGVLWLSEGDRVQAPLDPWYQEHPRTPGSRVLPPGVLLQRILLHKSARAVRALKRALPGVNPAVLGQLAGLSESARAERAAMGPPTTGPVNGVVPCQMAGPLECLPAGVALKGLHLRVGDTVSLQVRHVLKDPGTHWAAVALFLSRSPIGPRLPLSLLVH